MPRQNLAAALDRAGTIAGTQCADAVVDEPVIRLVAVLRYCYQSNW